MSFAGSMYVIGFKIANGYLGSFTVLPHSSPRFTWWSFSRMVSFPIGVSIVKPSSAFATLSEYVLPAFLIASARNCMPMYPWIENDDGGSVLRNFDRRSM